MDNCAIGIFDSGIGGLTTAAPLHRLLPNEKILYFGDTARAPYGTRPEDQIRRYALQIAENMHKNNVKLMGIACNTITAAALDVLQQSYPHIKIMGIIEPTARRAVKSAGPDTRLGIIATQVTVENGAYLRAIQALDPDIPVFQHPCSEFVPMVEQGLADSPQMDEEIHKVLDGFMKEYSVNTLVLGCTHFPLIAENLQRIYPGVRLINSAEILAEEIRSYLSENDMLADENAGISTFCASEMTDSFIDMVSMIAEDSFNLGCWRFPEEQ